MWIQGRERIIRYTVDACPLGPAPRGRIKRQRCFAKMAFGKCRLVKAIGKRSLAEARGKDSMAKVFGREQDFLRKALLLLRVTIRIVRLTSRAHSLSNKCLKIVLPGIFPPAAP